MRQIWRYILVLISGGCVAFLLLCAVCLIPQAAIQRNASKTAEFLGAKDDVFRPLIDGIASSKTDYYADSISVSIAYGLGEGGDIVQKIAGTRYYDKERKSANENLSAQVDGGKTANKEYARYWHGSAVLIRPLLTITDIEGIYIIGGVSLVILLIALLWRLKRDGEKIFAGAFLATFILVWGFLTPISMEYLWVFLITLGALIILSVLQKKKRAVIPLFFMIVGMVTNYFDFLTAETLTLTMPLLLIVWLERKDIMKKKWRVRAKKYAKLALLWLAGYLGMWLIKWILGAVVLRTDVWSLVAEHAAERSMGGMPGGGVVTIAIMGLIRNFQCLMPFCFGWIGLVIGVILGIIIIYFVVVYRKQKWNKYLLGILLAVGVIPVIRMIILQNHAYLHYFFTYRALSALILAGILILADLIDAKLIKSKSD